MSSTLANAQAVHNFTKTLWSDTYPFISPSKADLTGKSVLITGASRGIGKATAISYATAGADKIIIGARSDLTAVEAQVKQAAKYAGRKEPTVIAVNLDISSETSVKAAAELVDQEFNGRLDVLVCNAGHTEEWYPVAETTPKEWWNTFEVNLNGSYLCARYFIPLLLNGELKTLIMTSSVSAEHVATGCSAYSTSKFAICRLVEFISTEYEKQGIVAIAIHPGGVQTELTGRMPGEMAKYLTDKPELAADTTLWLTKEPRPWLSGRMVHANWDMEELEKKKDTVLARDLFNFRMTV